MHIAFPMRFPMTLDRFTKTITVFSLLLVGTVLPIQYLVVIRHIPVPALKAVISGVLLLVAAALLTTVLMAPRAVRVSSGKLVIERLWWFDYVLPMREVTAVEEGPPLTILGKVRRVAGNGGLMGFTGFFSVSDVGVVRCWATRLNVPTVLVRRREGKPLLLGVDDPAGLLQTLHRAAHV